MADLQPIYLDVRPMAVGVAENLNIMHPHLFEFVTGDPLQFLHIEPAISSYERHQCQSIGIQNRK